MTKDDVTISLNLLLRERDMAAVYLDASDVKNSYPHLTGQQALEVVEIIRCQTQNVINDFVDDLVWMEFPTAAMKLLNRARSLRCRLHNQEDESAKRLERELSGLIRLMEKKVDGKSDPATEGIIASVLDDIEKDANKEGGAK